MSKASIIILMGLIEIFIPIFGITEFWKRMVIVLAGVIIVVTAIYIKKEKTVAKVSVPSNKDDIFSENSVKNFKDGISQNSN